MSKRLHIILACGVMALCCASASDALAASGTRFVALDIFLEAAEPVAAWQFKLRERHGAMRVVGVETGMPKVFGDTSYYDVVAVAANKADQIIVADYSLAPVTQLPQGRFLLARLHLELSGLSAPDYNLILEVATQADGSTVPALINWQPSNLSVAGDHQ